MLGEVTFPMKRLFAIAVAGLLCVGAAARLADAETPKINVETGTMDGASYRIDMPEKWNGILIVYYHGYSEKPVVFEQDKPNGMGSMLAGAGYEVIQSGYSETGLAIEHAVPETEELRRYAIGKYGQPRETYVTGHSMGGQLTM